MDTIKEVLGILASNHTFSQKVNYLKYLFSKKTEILRYDPVSISIVATSRCTLSCDMCPTHSALVPGDYPHRQKEVKDMDFDMFRDIVDRFKNALTVNIIGSGEPLLNKDLFGMIDYASSRRMTVKTFSNGTTIGDNIENIINSKLDGITISLNGQDREEFNRMTGMDRSIYDTIYESVKKLIKERKKRASRLKVKLSFIIDRINYKAIPAMADVAIRLGADHAFFCNFLPCPYAHLGAEERVLTNSPDISEELKGIFSMYPLSVRKRLTLPTLVDPKMDGNRCNTYFSQARFDGDGNVSSCSMMLLDMTGHGNYKDKEIWNSDFFRSMRRLFLSGNDKDLYDPCKVCPDNKGVEVIL